MDGQHLEENLPCTAPHEEGSTLKHAQPVNNNVNMSIMRINTTIQSHLPLFTCPKCDKTFTTSARQRYHCRVHTGERPFGCTTCNKLYASLSGLQAHVISHINERPYACDRCDQTFPRLDALCRHQHVHTDERMYACEHCDTRFKCMGSLVRHKKGRCRKLFPVLTQQDVRVDGRDVSQTQPGHMYVSVECHHVYITVHYKL